MSTENNGRGIYCFTLIAAHFYTLVSFTLVSTIKTGVNE